MSNILNRIIQMEKALHALMQQFESESTTVENQMESSLVQCPLLPPKPDIHYAGDKIELIRVILSLSLLGRFVDGKGNLLPACKVFQFFGECLGMNLSKYLKDVGRTKQECTSMETQTEIFREMEKAIRKYFEEK